MPRSRTPLLLLVLLTSLLAACSSSSAADQDGEIVIGASAPLSGPRSEGGEAVQHGYQVWEELVNEAGGILGRPVRIIVQDDGSDQDRTVANYQALIDREQVDVLLGTFSSLQNAPAAAVAERHEMLFVCPSCGAPTMFEPAHYHMFFAQPATSQHQADLFAQWVAGLPADERPQTAAYPTMDDPFTQPIIESLREQLEAVGIETVYNEAPYPEDLNSFEAIANQVKAADPDLVAHGATVVDGINMIRAFQRVDFSPKVLFQTTAPSLAEQFAEGIGASNTEGIFYSVSWSPDASYQNNSEFVARYEEKFDGTPPEDAANAFGAAQVVQAAIEGVGSIEDQTALADWLHEHAVETVMGPISWDEVGRPQGEYLLAQWQQVQEEAEFESRIVLPRDVANTDQIVHPKPAWAGTE